MKTDRRHIPFLQQVAGGIFMPLAVALLCWLSPYGAMAVGSSVSYNDEDIYMQVVPGTSQTFSIPFNGLNAGTYFRITSKEPQRWSWEGAAIHFGRVSSQNGMGEMNIPVPGGLSSGDYYFDVQIGFLNANLMCYSEPVPVKVHLSKVGEDDAIVVCSGVAVQYTPDCVENGLSGAENYAWVRKAVNGIAEPATSGTGSFSEILTNTTDKAILVTYSYSVNESGCNGYETFDVKVIVEPWVEFQVVNHTPELCSGETTDILIIPAGVTYMWEVSGNGVYGIERGTGQIISQTLRFDGEPETTVKYHISPQGTKCFVEQQAEVKVKELPEIALNGWQARSALPFGEPISIEAYPAEYDNYSFTFNENRTEQSSPKLVVYEWKAEAANDASVTVVAGNGCANTASTTVDGPVLELPNAFTPNGDGINDQLYAGFDLEVYNPNGDLLYRGKDGWDGRYKGKLVPIGTYLYVVSYKTPEGKQIYQRYHVLVTSN